MRIKRRLDLSGVALAGALAAGCLGVGWLAVRSAAIHILPAGQPLLATIAPGDPDRLLGMTEAAFLAKRGRLSDADYAMVARAAVDAPLDARPYRFFAARHLIQADGRTAIPTLEAGRRLDPRDRWIRLYLLDQYLRAHRYADAANEFAVISRIVSGSGSAIAIELGRMSTDPDTADAVRRTLARDPELENVVLVELARSGASPQQVLAMASPRGLALAKKPDGWGTALVNAMVARHQYAAALAVWRKLYAVPAPADASPYDGELRGLVGGPPFNWSLTANDIGAADRADHGLSINYYGRQPGELANQLLVLAPGTYRLSFAIAGAPASNGGPALSWTIGCDGRENPSLLDGAIPATTGAAKGVAMQFTVPAEQCPAQWLRLVGSPGQFPGAMTATIQHIAIRSLETKQ